MSARIVPLSALCFVLLTIFCAVWATAQEPATVQSLVPVQNAMPFKAEPDLTNAQPLQNAPFTLSPQEEENLMRVLTDWQNMSGTVKTFEAKFKRWDYDGVFGNPNVPARVAQGTLKYQAPDKGSYEHKNEDAKDERYNEKWVCTGDSVFQFKFETKQVREHKLPENMKGTAISDGPMPFVFGVEAAKMRHRYWVRVTTPAAAAQQNQVWLEAYPKFSKDAENYYKVDVILKFEVADQRVTKLEPYAIKLWDPNQKNSTVFQLEDQKVNTWIHDIKLFTHNFIQPATPMGWSHQVVEETAGPPGPEAGPAPVIGTAPQPTTPR